VTGAPTNSSPHARLSRSRRRHCPMPRRGSSTVRRWLRRWCPPLSHRGDGGCAPRRSGPRRGQRDHLGSSHEIRREQLHADGIRRELLPGTSRLFPQHRLGTELLADINHSFTHATACGDAGGALRTDSRRDRRRRSSSIQRDRRVAPARSRARPEHGNDLRTPTTSGTFVFVGTATDADTCTGSQGYSLQVACFFSFSPSRLTAAVEGVAYTENLAITTGGTPPYAFAVVSGALPRE